MSDVLDNEDSVPDMNEKKSVDAYVKEVLEKLNAEKRVRIEQTLDHRYLNIAEAIEYLNKESSVRCTVHDLANFVLRDVLRPCFLYQGILSEVATYESYGEENEDVNDIEFSGYVTPVNKKNALLMLREFCPDPIPILRVGVVERIKKTVDTVHKNNDLSFEPPEIAEMYDELNNLAFSDRTVKYCEVTKDCNYDFSNQGILLYQSDCVFPESELQKIAKVASIRDRSPSSSDVNNADSISECLNECDKLRAENKKYKEAIEALRAERQDTITNPMQKSRVAQIIGKLILKAHPTHTKEKGLSTHGIISMLQTAAEIDQKTASFWIELAKDQEAK